MAIYLKEFILPNDDIEYRIILGEKRTIHNSHYPLGIFPAMGLNNIQFEPITCFYGENGAGKSTLLNIIANKLNAKRRNEVNNSSFFNTYLDNTEFSGNLCDLFEIKYIGSTDVFDYLLDIEAINSNVSRKKEEISKEYLYYKRNSASDFINEYDELKRKVDANSLTMSSYVRKRLGVNNIISMSNGETALTFFEREINHDGIYLIDEPENSLSIESQIKLKDFILDSMRFYNCQFIIATHSPILLSLNGAIIYDLDMDGCTVKKWTELKNVKKLFQFFMDNLNQF